MLLRVPFLRQLNRQIQQAVRQIEPSSLRVRLTLGIATVSALGLGGVAVWTSLYMQHLLISTQKENINYIADRFPHEVEIYSEMVPLQTAIQKTINHLDTNNTILWAKNTDGKVIAKSAALKEANDSGLLSLTNVPRLPEMQTIGERSWILCATFLKVNGSNLGKIYVARDITDDRMVFLDLVKNLAIASLITIGGMTIVIAIYIKRSLQPLHKIAQLTKTVSANHLGEAHIHLEKAPSEVKQLAQTFDQMLVRLSEAWEHQRQLVSNVSHELRTPLTIVSGYVQSTLRRGDNLTPNQREALATAVSEADRTVQILQDLLDLARAESGRIHLQLEEIAVNSFLAEVAQMARQCSDRPIKLQLPSQPLIIKADANRLKQVLLNLIDNAVKYSDAQPIRISLKQQQDKAIIAVSDRGVGIPLQQQARIFERFYRVDEARNRAGGTGLGLSIVKILVESMGGSVAVRSQLGEGSTFTVTFLLANP